MKEKRIQLDGQDSSYLVRDDGTIWSEKRNRTLKGTIQRNEYHTVYLTHNNKQYNLMVHRLVAEAFCPNPHNYTIVHHKDNNPFNNCADNLEWVTTWENNQSENKKEIRRKANYEKADMTKDWRPLKFSDQYGINSAGEMINFKTGRKLAGQDRNGYKRFQYENRVYSIHRLVYETFVGPIPEGMKVDHIDGNRSNNALSNLRLVTQSENMKNAMANGHSGQVPVLQFTMAGVFIKEFPTIQAAADEVGVSHAAIRSALNHGGRSAGFRWKRKE